MELSMRVNFIHREVAFTEFDLVLILVPSPFMCGTEDVIFLDFTLVIPVEVVEESVVIKEVIFGCWMNSYFV